MTITQEGNTLTIDGKAIMFNLPLSLLFKQKFGKDLTKIMYEQPTSTDAVIYLRAAGVDIPDTISGDNLFNLHVGFISAANFFLMPKAEAEKVMNRFTTFLSQKAGEQD